MSAALDSILEIREQPLVGEIEGPRVPPIVLERLVQASDEVLVAHLDREFTTAVEAARCQVDGADDGRGPVAKQRLAVQLQVLQLVNLDADVVQDAQAAHALNDLVSFERVRSTGHHFDFDASAPGAHQPLDHDRILNPLVLDEESVPGVVDELADTISAGSRAPHEMRLLTRRERLTMPVGVEPVD